MLRNEKKTVEEYRRKMKKGNENKMLRNEKKTAEEYGRTRRKETMKVRRGNILRFM